MVQLKKVLVLGSDGLVGSAFKRSKKLNNDFNIYYSNREDADLTYIDDVERLFDDVKPDIVINCAGKVGGILANSTQKFEFLSENLRINLNLFTSLNKRSDITFINLGSSSIYPKNAKNPLKEKYLMTGELETTNAPYSLSKIVGIELGRSLSKNSLRVINVIPTNLYGPNDNFDPISSHVVPGLISKIHAAKIDKENNYTVWGSGNPLRELLYVDDLVDAIEVVLKNPKDFDIINVGSNIEISIRDLAIKIKKLVGFEGEIVFDKTKPDGVERKTLDSSKIHSLDWRPVTNLDIGLKTTYEWYIENK